MKTVLICIVTLLSVAFTNLTALTNDILLETNLTELSQNALDTMYGKGNFIVRVRVALTAPKYEVNYTKESAVKMEKSNAKEQEVYILPGVPALKNIAPENFNTMPFDSVTELIKPKVKKLQLVMIVNRNLPRGKAQDAENMMRELLNFKKGRDDIKVTFKTFELFNENPQKIAMLSEKIPFLTYQNLFYLLMVLLLLTGIGSYIWFQRYQLKYMHQKGLEQSRTSASPATPQSEYAPVSHSTQSESTGMKQYFSFVNDANIDEFIFILNAENISVEYFSIIVSFLPPVYGAKVLSQLEMPQKISVIRDSITEQLANQNLVEQIESKLKSAMECFIGGQKRVSHLLSELSSIEKKELLTFYQAEDPENYPKLRGMVILFEDIIKLNQSDIKLLLSDLHFEVLGAALLKEDPLLVESIIEALPFSSHEVLMQFIELKQGSISDQRIQAAQEEVVSRLKTLVASGKIVIPES